MARSRKAPKAADASPKIPRPRNAWILYRCAKLIELQTSEPAAVHQMQNVSKSLSVLWRAEPPEVVAKWQAVADDVKAKHAEMYPEYKYTPQQKKDKVQKQKERNAAEKAASMAAVKATKKTKATRGSRFSTPPSPFLPTSSSNSAPSSSSALPPAPLPSVPAQMLMHPASATSSGYVWHPNPAIPANASQPHYGPDVGSMNSSFPGGENLAPQLQGELPFDMNEYISYPLDEQEGDGAVDAATPGLGLSLYPSQGVDDGELMLPIEFGYAGGHTAMPTMTGEQFSALLPHVEHMWGNAGFDPRAYDFDAYPLFGSAPVDEGSHHQHNVYMPVPPSSN